MTAHTPGPWHVGMRPGPMVYGMLGEQIADCRGIDDAGYNARLIAAAPALLDALWAIIEAARMSDQPRALYCAEIARAAIAQATGEE